MTAVAAAKVTISAVTSRVWNNEERNNNIRAVKVSTARWGHAARRGMIAVRVSASIAFKI